MNHKSIPYIKDIYSRWQKKYNRFNDILEELTSKDIYDVPEIIKAGKRRLEYKELIDSLDVMCERNYGIIEAMEPKTLLPNLIDAFSKGDDFMCFEFMNVSSPALQTHYKTNLVIIECILRSSLKILNRSLKSGNLDFSIIDDQWSDDLKSVDFTIKIQFNSSHN
jgi:hypothetical protein